MSPTAPHPQPPHSPHDIPVVDISDTGPGRTPLQQVMELMRAHGPVVSLALLGDIEDDTAFLTGYRKAGGRADFGPAARRRLALYRSYLYLIMLIETVPRAVGDDDVVWTRKVVAPQLVAALDDIGRHGACRSIG
jgi:hypothetical protein